jgi:isoleucyl-tRNA synthetase
MAEDKGLTRSQREEKVLKFWKENKVFEKALEKNSPKGDFVFYEGPPTANGKPGIHHLEARAFKDAIPRYKTMKGFHVARKAGWDTHGLPVEIETEKKLGLKSKREIEEYGVAKFNEECRKSVWTYVDLWEKFTDRIGYWVDLKHPYITYENSYIESVWNIIGEVEKKGLLYKDYKVVPWCPRCGTGLSSHELAQGYQDVKDISLYVKFKLKAFPNAYFLAWTTTPWTLPGNLALAVGPDIDYVEAKVGEEIFVLAKERLSVIDVPYEIVAEHKGKDMVGMEYEPLYDFAKDKNPEGIDKAFKVYTADFVTTTDGTGIVHTAVMYGQDDFVLGTEVGLPKMHLVSPDATFITGTGFLEGQSVVEESTAVEVLKDLQGRGLLYKKEGHTHSYPFCWRCKTRLIYYARDSWYIRMSKLRDELVKENAKINWEPEHIKEGRFGEWLREVKDWSLSRERYWGTPLPVWESLEGDRIVIDSIETLKKYSKPANNTYFVMRHGQAENNVKRVVSIKADVPHHLSDLGKDQVAKTAFALKDKGVDLIVASPFARTKETAEMVAEALGLTKSAIVLDERLREFGAGDFDGKSEDELHEFLHSRDMFAERCPGGENFYETKKRLGEALFDLEKTYSGKRILIVTHKICGWLLTAAGKKLDAKESEALDVYMKNAELRPLELSHLPHNENFELDLHKPYIDEAVLAKDGKEYRRTKEVMDVWLDSGAMPFAQDPKNIKYPADYISEAIDQTRGWFYTLHAVGVLMGKGNSYKNVICLGHILDKEGKKMSKSVGNVIEPFEAIEKYGADTLRLWMYSVNQPGESKNFDERTVEEVQKRVFNLLDNVYAFYELYRDKNLESNIYPESKNILDKWILAKLSLLTDEVTESLDAYKLLEPVRSMRDFIGDLSTWYLRRSRDRLKSGDLDAKKTLYYVLKTISKLLAPFAPFSGEELYQKLRTDKDNESVHLEVWPTGKKPITVLSLFSKGKADEKLLTDMDEVRRLVSLALEARSRANLKIRQPLANLKVKNLTLSQEYIELIKDEVNVKEVVEGKSISEEVELDTELTQDLIEEGEVREIIRSIQDMRKERGLVPGELMQIAVPDDKEELYAKHAKLIKQTTSVEYVSQ